MFIPEIKQARKYSWIVNNLIWVHYLCIIKSHLLPYYALNIDKWSNCDF